MLLKKLVYANFRWHEPIFFIVKQYETLYMANTIKNRN
jgi:hypothetical protein